ncbi:MAG: family 10 glycosylhydrolase [Bacteroidaceae bacterium]|nr:family 10 glycosylhydrolase [Bacteroidaceae bacterium]
MKRGILLIMLLIATFAMGQNPKREFRGAWIQSVNGQFQNLGRERMQEMLTSQLDILQQDGINAIFFQVRVEGDALYESSMEPWSRFLTGQQGTPPNPYWDPLQWMIEQCHQRGMELHAWINPYRAKTKATTELATTHPYFQHPENFFAYDNLLIFDPGVPENRDYICRVACDIAQRYDIDGLHIDDYFYPYPVAGQPIPDDVSYSVYGKGLPREDWRRQNVNLFVKELGTRLRAVKPWLKFGVSPFGIYRNQKNDPHGSATGGLQNYDDLYADVLEWIRQGWVDYNIPQIYWEIGHATADYETLIRWWDRYAGDRPLYIGQDVMRTVKFPDPANPQSHQMIRKYQLQRLMPNVQGSCQWYAAAVCENPGNYGEMLRQYYHKTPALQPLMPWIDHKAPGKPTDLAMIWTSDGPMLFWTPPKAKNEMDEAWQYVVYRFPKGAQVDLNDAAHIVCITRQTMIPLDYRQGTEKYTYVVTALDRLHNESKGAKKTIKL